MEKDWKRLNIKCSKCKKSLYKRLFSSKIYSQGDVVCPTHGLIDK